MAPLEIALCNFSAAITGQNSAIPRGSLLLLLHARLPFRVALLVFAAVVNVNLNTSTPGVISKWACVGIGFLFATNTIASKFWGVAHLLSIQLIN
jgi:hypothetical protein